MNYYTYIIVFVTGYYYYGMRSCECLPKDDVYFGSPITHKEHWSTTMYTKTILNTYQFHKECSKAENDLIKPVYKTDPFCLNVNCAGAINLTPEVINKRITAIKKSMTPEVCTKISVGNKGKKRSAETRSKMSAAKKGTKASPETRSKMSAARSGENNPNFGKTTPPEVCAKISAAMKGREITLEWQTKIIATKKRRREEKKMLNKNDT